MPTTDFQFSDAFTVNKEVKKHFDDYGFILIRNLLSGDEMEVLKPALETDEGVLTKAYNVSDGGDEKNARLCVWNHPGDDITGMVARSEKVVTTLEELMGGEMYHYHTKLMMKEPHGGGRWGWHQDYGYWYHNSLMYPNMATCFIAVDNMDTKNGCMQFIPGSHKAGRMDHQKIAGQMEADAERVEYFAQILGIKNIELQPGDAVMFHGNLLHKSERNNSANRRWAFVMAYNRADNNPTKKHHHPRYVKINKVPNEAIKDCSTKTDLRNKGFLQQTGDASMFTIEDEHLN